MAGRVKSSTIRFFADDTRLLKVIESLKHVSELQEDLTAVCEWAKHNNMQLHEDKFEYICHGGSPNSIWSAMPFAPFAYTLPNSCVLTPIDNVRDLGVTVSSDLSWAEHLSEMAFKGRSMASWILSAFRTRDKTSMMLLYKSLVRSLLEYCCVLWNPKLIMLIQQLGWRLSSGHLRRGYGVLTI